MSRTNLKSSNFYSKILKIFKIHKVLAKIHNVASVYEIMGPHGPWHLGDGAILLPMGPKCTGLVQSYLIDK